MSCRAMLPGSGVLFRGKYQGFPFANLDVCETDTQLVNRLFYLVPETSSGELRCFFYYEENLFTKDSKGNLNLVESSLHLFNP